jgi:hypothetical protein
MSHILSKSKYLVGLQCPKYLWIQLHEPERIPGVDAVTQYLFDQGHMVGELSKMLFPDGIEVPFDDFTESIKQTGKLLRNRKPLFEASITAGGIYSRVDILNPVGEDEWDIVEVKSSTSVKKVHIDDVSFQKHCCDRRGVKIRNCFLMHINNEYIKDGEIDREQLFEMQDISEEVEEATIGIEERIKQIFEVLSAMECPEVGIGKHCADPYGCPLTECWEFLPEGHVFNLYRGGVRSFKLFEEGILAISEIPDDYQLSGAQQIQKGCALTGEPYINREGIKDFLSNLQYPLYYLDFETFGPGIPIFDGTRPYQNIPFQFSIHVVKDEESTPEHFSFLADGIDDPRPVLLSELKKVLGDSGSIVVYNQGFEEGILRDLGKTFPEYDDWVGQVCDRLVDLLKPFSRFYYYHPLQKGSASLKNVLPALTGRGYEDMDIANGQEASITFQAVTYGESTEEERLKVREDLLKYCKLDTEGMIWVVERLRIVSIV